MRELTLYLRSVRKDVPFDILQMEFEEKPEEPLNQCIGEADTNACGGAIYYTTVWPGGDGNRDKASRRIPA
jgi:hypothetical protein